MTTAEDVLRVARTQIGTVQAANGSNPYGRAYGMDRVAWCAQFVWWCFREAGGSALIHPKTAYTPTSAQWHRDRRQWGTTPRVGALVYFDWPGDGVDRISHIGIVEAVEQGAIVTIEGNTTSGTAGDQRMGGGVWRRRRALNSSIVGYGYPAYAAATVHEEDDLTPEEKARLERLEQKMDLLLSQLVVGEGRIDQAKTWGWTGWGGGTGEKLTVVDQGRRTNVEVRQARNQITSLDKRLTEVLAAVQARPAGTAAAAAAVPFEFSGVATPRV